MSGPDTSGSFGLNGIPFTNDAPKRREQPTIFLLTTTANETQIMRLLKSCSLLFSWTAVHENKSQQLFWKSKHK